MTSVEVRGFAEWGPLNKRGLDAERWRDAKGMASGERFEAFGEVDERAGFKWSPPFLLLPNLGIGCFRVCEGKAGSSSNVWSSWNVWAQMIYGTGKSIVFGKCRLLWASRWTLGERKESKIREIRWFLWNKCQVFFKFF